MDQSSLLSFTSGLGRVLLCSRAQMMFDRVRGSCLVKVKVVFEEAENLPSNRKEARDFQASGYLRSNCCLLFVFLYIPYITKS